MDGAGPGIRGEVSLMVCGRQTTIAPTYRAIDSIEARLGVGIPKLLQRAFQSDVRVRDLAIIVHEGLRGAGHTGKNGDGDLFTLDEVGEDVLQNFSRYAIACGEFLGNALGGPVEKKADAPEPQRRAARG